MDPRQHVATQRLEIADVVHPGKAEDDVLDADLGQRAEPVYDLRRRASISRLIPGNTDPHCVTFGYPDTATLGAFVDQHFAPEPAV